MFLGSLFSDSRCIAFLVSGRILPNAAGGNRDTTACDESLL